MERNQKMLPVLLLLLTSAAAGCGHSGSIGLAPLDQPASVKASGAQPQSEVTLYRMGTLDPRGALVTLKVSDVSLRLVTNAEQATVQELTIKLSDVDLPATESMPHGVNLRQQQLRLTAPVTAPMTQRELNALTVRAHTSLQYRAAIILDNGSLYTLGASQTEAADIDLRATRYESGVHVTVDAAPQGKCWSIPGVLEVSDCSLYVETDGDATSE